MCIGQYIQLGIRAIIPAIAPIAQWPQNPASIRWVRITFYVNITCFET